MNRGQGGFEAWMFIADNLFMIVRAKIDTPRSEFESESSA